MRAATIQPMTQFSDILMPGSVVATLAATSKKELFQQFGALAAYCWALDPRAVADGLGEREKLGSTGFGAGVAIPHARLPGLRHVVGMFARLAQPIEFQAVDDLPVDLVFAMLSPPEAGAEHLKVLAMVSRRLRDPGFTAKLRGAGSPDAIFALFTQAETRDAA